MSSAAKKYLVLVESPAKCSKIESFLGPNFKCMASFGHIRELSGLASINTDSFELTYTVMKTRTKQLKKIKTYKTENNCEIIIATDDDREGEAIGWHLCQYLKLPVKTTKRIIFHEITKPAILAAVQSPTVLNEAIIDAQKARQVLDMLVGYKVSPLLWKNITRQAKSALSAGRCQTPTLRLIYDNYVQIKNNPGKLVYKTTGCFTKHNIPFNLQHEFETPDQVIEFLEASHDFTENGGVYSIKKDKIKQKKVAPPLPLITSTLQQQASNKFNMGSKETMKHAQTLYEKGYITYMRTDSKKYSGEFIESTTAHIVETYGGEYVNPLIDDLSLIVKTRTVENMDKIKAGEKKGKKVKVGKASTKKTPVDGKEKEADTPHEAVRPTDILLENIPERYPPRTKSLYRLIRTHALQSCMSSATFTVLTVRIPTVLTVDNEDDEVGEVRTYEYRASAEEMLFAGWMVLNTGRVEDRNYNYLQSLGEGSTVGCQGIRGVQQLKDAVRHYTEAALIQLLEKRGIGRPSTFASLIGKIQERGYAVKGSVSGRVIMCRNFELSDVGEIIEEEAETQFNAEKNKLVIQPLGILVIEFLIKHLDALFDYGYTCDMERRLDMVVDGDLSYLDACRDSLAKIAESVGVIGCDKQTFIIDAEHTFMIGKHGPVIKKTLSGANGGAKGANGGANGGSCDVEFLGVREDIDMDRLRDGGYTLAELLREDIGKNKDRLLGDYQNNPVILKNGKFGHYVVWGEDGGFKKTLKGLDKKYGDIVLADVVKELAGSASCLRVISDVMSIRSGKYGPYVYYKTVEMKRPMFKSLKTFKENYMICDVVILMKFIDK